MKNKNVLNSPRLLVLKKKRRKDLRNRILFYFIISLLMFIVLVFISRIDRLNIVSVEINGNKVIDTELINEVVMDNLSGYYLYFIPKTNFLFFPKNKIKKDLSNKFQRLSNISLNLDNSGILKISVSERNPEYVWCGDQFSEIFSTNTLNEENLCYFMDKDGYVFDLAPFFSGDVYFKFFGALDVSKTDSPLGVYFSPDVFYKIISLKEILLNMNLEPVAVSVKNDGDIEIYLSSTFLSLNSPKIILKKDFILEQVSENLQASISTDPLKSDIKNKYNSLLYIDLRFGNKVYYKFQ